MTDKKIFCGELLILLQRAQVMLLYPTTPGRTELAEKIADALLREVVHVGPESSDAIILRKRAEKAEAELDEADRRGKILETALANVREERDRQMERVEKAESERDEFERQLAAGAEVRELRQKVELSENVVSNLRNAVAWYANKATEQRDRADKAESELAARSQDDGKWERAHDAQRERADKAEHERDALCDRSVREAKALRQWIAELQKQGAQPSGENLGPGPDASRDAIGLVGELMEDAGAKPIPAYRPGLTDLDHVWAEIALVTSKLVTVSQRVEALESVTQSAERARADRGDYDPNAGTNGG